MRPRSDDASMSDTQRTIVIGVDYSDHSIHAVDEALRAQAARGARLVPVLVLPGGPVTGVPVAEAMTRELVERSQENLAQLLEARARALGVALGPVEPRVVFGPPAERLIEAARASNAELVVVGTHGREGLSHLLLGSVADEVMRKAPCSVLVARARAESGAAAARGPAAAGVEPSPPPPAGEVLEGEPASATVVSEPHIDADRVVLQVLDTVTGQVFVCAFQDATTLSIEPLARSWVPAPSSDARARVARIAHATALEQRSLFEELFEEIGRRRARASGA